MSHDFVTDLLLKYSAQNIFDYFIKKLDMLQGRELTYNGSVHW